MHPFIYVPRKDSEVASASAELEWKDNDSGSDANRCRW